LVGVWLFFLGFSATAAERIVSLAPSMTDVVLELGAQQQLVGVLDAGERQSGLAHLLSIGRYGQVSIEQIISLHSE
jgi:vitamin B12 transport system substrate-binding protein